MAEINFDDFGYNQVTARSANATLAITDVGVVQNCTSSITLTLPATVVGYVFIVRVGKEGLTVNVSPNAADKIAGNGFTAADDKDAIFTTQPAGSFIVLIGDGVNGWFFHRVHGTVTRET
jgi:hypothetical protein